MGGNEINMFIFYKDICEMKSSKIVVLPLKILSRSITSPASRDKLNCFRNQLSYFYFDEIM